jgi:hypothetical protein
MGGGCGWKVIEIDGFVVAVLDEGRMEGSDVGVLAALERLLVVWVGVEKRC